MTYQQINHKFNQAVNWNAYAYVAYKTINTAVTFVLFSMLSTNHFAAWANINSIIFLTLLWVDCGFRKSLPRYCPEFAKNKQTMIRFISNILFAQSVLIAATLPIIVFAGTKIAATFTLCKSKAMLLMGVLFAVEGITAITRLVYHSYFWQKQYNLTTSIVLGLEALANIFVATTFATSCKILQAVLINKILANLLIITVSGAMLKRMISRIDYTNEIINYKKTMRAFVKHSGIMWLNTSLRSLTERNFLLPLLTATAGSAAAGIFKVANDGALFFQRIVLKTIGTTDTSLLAHTQALPDGSKLLNVAFKKLTTKVAALCLPLLGFILFVLAMSPKELKNNFGFQLFIIIAMFYLIESLFLPFERVLEVHRNYWYLIGTYMSAALFLIPSILLLYYSWIGIIPFITLLYSVRLVSVLFMTFTGKRLYNLAYPFKSFLLICFIVFLSFFILYCFAQVCPTCAAFIQQHVSRVVMKSIY